MLGCNAYLRGRLGNAAEVTTADVKALVGSYTHFAPESIARRQRMAELMADLVLEIKGHFDQDVSYRYDVLTPQSADYTLAEQLVLRDPVEVCAIPTVCTLPSPLITA